MTEQTNIPDQTLIVVADGAQARLLRNERTDNAVSLRQVATLNPDNLEDDGPAGVRPPDQTPQQTDEATFAKQLGRHLNQMAHAKKFDHIVLAADPQTLGQLREVLHQEVSERLVTELAKTLTNVPLHDIEKHFA